MHVNEIMDVLMASRSGGMVKFENRKAIIEILAKLCSESLVEDYARGSDDADIAPYVVYPPSLRILRSSIAFSSLAWSSA